MTFVYKLYLHTSFSNMAQLQNISSICLQIVKSIFYGPSFKFLDLPLKNAVLWINNIFEILYEESHIGQLLIRL